MLQPETGQAVRFRAHHNGRGWSEIDILIKIGSLQFRGIDIDLMLLQPRQCFFGGADSRLHGKEATHPGADHVGIVEVSLGIADDYGIHGGSVSRTQNSTQVARLLHCLEKDDKRIVGEPEIVRTICDLGIASATIPSEFSR